ncbi:MAG: DUF4846 domain-containing protein [Leptospiraceae bacterium]|nr:DUF4846 domain-containing protein [Leptospiraceae bacterium]
MFLRKTFSLILILILFLFCIQISSESIFIDAKGKVIKERFRVPKGYKRIKSIDNSFAEYLQNLPLKRHGTKVMLFNGKIKTPEDVYDAVIDIDVGEKDLQQCADAVMRLRAEYLYSKGRYEDIHFNFTNGFSADYSKFALGNRINVKGNSVTWKKTSDKDYSYETFRKYLDIVYSYAGSASLSKELISVKNFADIKIGDVLIQGGFPGHAVIVVDMAKSIDSGEKIFLFAQSYMPAQDIQILKNPEKEELSPWYSSNILDTIVTPEWEFKKTDLKRFN